MTTATATAPSYCHTHGVRYRQACPFCLREKEVTTVVQELKPAASARWKTSLATLRDQLAAELVQLKRQQQQVAVVLAQAQAAAQALNRMLVAAELEPLSVPSRSTSAQRGGKRPHSLTATVRQILRDRPNEPLSLAVIWEEAQRRGATSKSVTPVQLVGQIVRRMPGTVQDPDRRWRWVAPNKEPVSA